MAVNQPIDGMTVNERLAHLQLFEAFDAAATARDFDRLVDVLLRARLSREQAEQTARALIANPKLYGF